MFRVGHHENPFFNNAPFNDPESLTFEANLLSTIQAAQEPADIQGSILSGQESSQPSISQEKIGSLLFRKIATQVIKGGENAVLELETLLKLITKTKKDSAVDNILSRIRLLFKDQNQITIIDNKLLNSQLTDLANGIGNKRGNDKKIEDINKVLYD
ncbi:hypothetical protein RMCBS344292_18724 [Rhizopus microsporus]|nr:hypothetical protein RMCBS344292_18724 [Rhizopus microsporus]